MTASVSTRGLFTPARDVGGLLLRPAVPGDARALVDFSDAARDIHILLEDAGDAAMDPVRMQVAGEVIDGGCILLALDGPALAAVASVEVPPGAPALVSWEVRPGMRRRGLGAAVARAILARLFEAGVTEVRAEPEVASAEAVAHLASLGFDTASEPFTIAPGRLVAGARPLAPSP